MSDLQGVSLFIVGMGLMIGVWLVADFLARACEHLREISGSLERLNLDDATQRAHSEAVREAGKR